MTKGGSASHSIEDLVPCISGGQFRHFMDSIQSLLEQIGLNHHESGVYSALLQSGEQPASGLARQLKMPRSTVRNSLDKLCERGIVQKVYKRNTQYYRCKSPESLQIYIQKRIERSQENLLSIQKVLPMLTAMHEQSDAVPKVQFFEGPDGVIEAFNHSLYQDIDELLFFTSYQFLHSDVIKKNDDEFYIPLRIKKGIHLRVLAGDSKEAYIASGTSKQELRQRRTIPKKYEVPGNIHIYGNFVAYFSVSETECMAILIESTMMANTMRALFAFMWDACK